MFNLKKVIEQFNRCYNKKISRNKTWRLVYLQPSALTFLNKVDSFIHNSSYHSSHFVGPRRIVREKLKILKNQPPSDALTIMHSVNEALAKDYQLTLRLN